MNRSASLVPVRKAHSGTEHVVTTTTTSLCPQPCPVCGQASPQKWLEAPDRFHGKQEKYTLMRCPVCSLVWLSHPPMPNEMHLHYTDAYDRLISAAGEGSPGRWRDRNAALAPHKESGALLDLGCSSGSFLQSLCGEAWDLYGIE